MSDKSSICAVFAMALTMAVASCNKNYFDQERYEELVTATFPVANIDSLHDWNLLTSVTISADFSVSPKGTYVVDVYDSNPVSGNAVKFTSSVVNSNGIIKFNAPKDKSLKSVYIVAADGDQCIIDGKYDIVNDGLFLYTMDDATMPAPKVTSYQPNEFTYCFEETFPEGGDFDFNDCVMGVSIDKSPKEVNGVADYAYVTVRLRAVGGYKNMAASMRLDGITPDMLAPTFTITQKGWEYFKYAVDYIPDPDGAVIKEKYGDARIDLFNDAHFALNGGRTDESGTIVPRACINTKGYTENPEWETSEPKSSTYRIEFLNNDAFEDFDFTDLDLFIITAYNSTYYEIHTPRFFGRRVIKDYPTNINYLPWALVIPDKFRYPYEGMPVGQYSSGLNYYEGAYQRAQYSFGAWARNRNNTTSWGWFHYPLDSSVYPLN
ncbi:MAG: LruC domain-containing protein [Prevotellaceae bacterium]|nr:LruC domain-containing protein [Prevotellaceae bacterium]